MEAGRGVRGRGADVELYELDDVGGTCGGTVGAGSPGCDHDGYRYGLPGGWYGGERDGTDQLAGFCNRYGFECSGRFDDGNDWRGRGAERASGGELGVNPDGAVITR